MSTTPQPPSTQPYQAPPNGFRTFIIVWITQSISVMGSALTFFSVIIWLTQVLFPRPEQKPDLAWALSATGLTFGLPNVFISPFAGAWADRHDRKRTMQVADFISGCLSLSLVVLIVSHQLNLPILLGIMTLFSVVGSFHGSAFDTSYAMLVPDHQLPRANGMMQTMWSLSGILSPAIAAALISLPALARQGLVGGEIGAFLGRMENGTPVAITIDAVTFFIAAATLIFLFVPSPRRADLADTSKPRRGILVDIQEGALYIWRRQPMLWLLGTFTMANLLTSIVEVLQPLLLKFNLASDWTARGFTLETALALLTTVGSIGGVVGGVAISAWGGLKRRRVYGVLIPMIVGGIAQIGFGLSLSIYLTAVMAAVMVGMIPFLNAHSQTIWQTQTPRELQGRVFSVRRVIAQFSVPLGTILAGFLGGLFNPGTVIAFSGGILVVFCLAQLFNPSLLQVEDKAYLDKLAESKASPG